MNNKRLIQTMLSSGLAVLIGYAINFTVTPYITENLGVDVYGFVSLANTFTSYAGIVTLALTAFVVRYISVAYHENDMKTAGEYYSSSIFACTMLTAILFVICLVIVANLQVFLKIPTEIVDSVKVLFLIVFLNFSIVTMTTPFGTSAYIKNRLDITGYIRSFSKIIEAAVIVLLFLVFAPKVWFVAVGAVVASLITLLLSCTLTKKLTPELRFSKDCVCLAKIKNLFKNGLWSSVNQLGNVLNSGLDLLVANLMLSPIQTGQIAVAKTIGTIFATLFQTISQPFEPILLKSYAQGDKNEFFQSIRKAMLICGFFGAVAFAGFFALGKVYYTLWMPSQDAKLLHKLTVLTIFNYITDSILRPVYYINTLTVKNKIPCYVTIVGGLLNVVFMFILIQYTELGVYAVVLTTAVIMVGINLFFNPVYAAQCIQIKASSFYLILVRHILACMVMCFVFRLIAMWIQPMSWLALVFGAGIMVMVGAVLYTLINCDLKELLEAVTIHKK